MDDRLGKANTLAIAFGQLPDQLRADIGEGAFFRGFLDAFGDVGFGYAFQPSDEIEILADLHIWIDRRRFRQISDALLNLHGRLQHVEPGDFRRARRRRHEARQHPHRCRLASSIRSQEANDLALLDFEGNVIDGDSARVSLGETFDFNHNFDR